MGTPDFEDIYKVFFNTIAEGLLIVNSQGEIIMANPRAGELFACDKDELLNEKVESLIPMASRKKHVKLRENYQKDPHKRQMGQNLNLQAVRKDGSMFDVEISLNYFHSQNETYVVPRADTR